MFRKGPPIEFEGPQYQVSAIQNKGVNPLACIVVANNRKQRFDDSSFLIKIEFQVNSFDETVGGAVVPEMDRFVFFDVSAFLHCITWE